MTTALQYAAAIGLAGFLGALARYYVALFCTGRFGDAFPVGTMVINLSGSFFLGWFMTFTAYRTGFSPAIKLAIATGFVGAYTTFSTWMYESFKQLNSGDLYKGLFNLLGSIALGLLAVWLGVICAGGPSR